jgi:hypothetical protein
VAGTILISSESRWSAASWLFDWCLRTIAQELGPGDLSARLTGIVGENLGSLDLADLSTSERQEIEKVVHGSLVGLAETELPVELENRAGVLEHLRSLAELC